MDTKHLKGKHYLFSPAPNPLPNAQQEFHDFFFLTGIIFLKQISIWRYIVVTN